MFSDVTSESILLERKHLSFHMAVWHFQGNCLLEAVSASAEIELGVPPACGVAAGGPGIGPCWSQSGEVIVSDWAVPLEKRRTLCGILVASRLTMLANLDV